MTNTASEEARSYEISRVVMAIGAGIVLLGTFLPWAGNPIASVSGLDLIYGKLTVLSSLVIFGIATWNDTSKRTLGSFTVAVVVFILAISSVLMTSNRYVRPQEGLMLALLGSIIVAAAGIWGYADYTSIRRATIVGVVVFIATWAAVIGLSYGFTQAMIQSQTDAVSVKRTEVYFDESLETSTTIKNPTSWNYQVDLTVNIILHPIGPPDSGEYFSVSWSETIPAGSTRSYGGYLPMEETSFSRDDFERVIWFCKDLNCESEDISVKIDLTVTHQ